MVGWNPYCVSRGSLRKPQGSPTNQPRDISIINPISQRSRLWLRARKSVLVIRGCVRNHPKISLERMNIYYLLIIPEVRHLGRARQASGSASVHEASVQSHNWDTLSRSWAPCPSSAWRGPGRDWQLPPGPGPPTLPGPQLSVNHTHCSLLPWKPDSTCPLGPGAAGVQRLLSELKTYYLSNPRPRGTHRWGVG